MKGWKQTHDTNHLIPPPHTHTHTHTQSPALSLSFCSPPPPPVSVPTVPWPGLSHGAMGGTGKGLWVAAGRNQWCCLLNWQQSWWLCQGFHQDFLLQGRPCTNSKLTDACFNKNLCYIGKYNKAYNDDIFKSVRLFGHLDVGWAAEFNMMRSCPNHTHQV